MDEPVRLRVIDTKHPVLTRQYAIYTPPIDELVVYIGDAIDQRVSGIYIYGPSRFGKSRGVKWHLRRELELRFKRTVPLVIWPRPDSVRREAEFWNLLLLASKFEFAKPYRPKKKLDARFLFKEQLITLACKARNNFVALLIDEAQDVTVDEWKWLMGLQNELDLEGYLFSVFSVGSHQMQYQPDFLARTGLAHISARFFSRAARFYGLRDVEELRYVLAGYDDDSEWPPGSKSSFLHHFAGDSYASGKRLSNHVQQVWDAFCDQLPNAFTRKKERFEIELPMLHVANLVETVLAELANGVEWDDVLNPARLRELIKSGGFCAHMTLVSEHD